MIFSSDLGILHRIRTSNVNTVVGNGNLASDNSSKPDCRSQDNGLDRIQQKRTKRVTTRVFQRTFYMQLFRIAILVYIFQHIYKYMFCID